LKANIVTVIDVLREKGPLSFEELITFFNERSGKAKKIKAILKKLNSRGKIQLSNNLIRLKGQKGKHSEPDEPKTGEFEEIVKKHKLRSEFSGEILAEAKKVAVIKEEDYKGREDLREQLCITIDGEDAKDLDDAVYLEKHKSMYKLYVHIADVSHYVRFDSLLDREAVKRGTSIYLVDKVIPMLPKALSNDVCSLNSGVDRLALSVVIDIDLSGKLKKYHFFKSVIKVKRRYTYNEVDAVLSSSEGDVSEEHMPFLSMLKEMKELAEILISDRFKKGSIDFDVNEIYIVCDEESNPVDVKLRERLISHKIVEEFMLKANKCAARFLGERGHSIFRVHDIPDPEKLKTFFDFMRKLNYHVKSTDDIKGTFLHQILQKVKGTKDSKLVNTLLLRSMKQAVYHTENRGHYGLGFKDYTHFTSPIRRYPDLMIHRLIKQKFEYDKKSKRLNSIGFLNKIAERSSKLERIAMEAEREMVKIKSATFLKGRIGEVFDATVSGLSDFGMFVEIKPYGIEGLIMFKNLKGYFDFDEANYVLRSKSGKTYQMGDALKVELLSVNTKRGFIDFKAYNEK
jgi:ribonuclease R